MATETGRIGTPPISPVQEEEEKQRLLPQQEATLRTSSRQYQIRIPSSEENQITTNLAKSLFFTFSIVLLGSSIGFGAAVFLGKLPPAALAVLPVAGLGSWCSMNKVREIENLENINAIEGFKRYYRSQTFDTIYHNFESNNNDIRCLNLYRIRELDLLSIEELREKFCLMIQTTNLEDISRKMIQVAAGAELLTSSECQILRDVGLNNQLDAQRTAEIRESLFKSMMSNGVLRE